MRTTPRPCRLRQVVERRDRRARRARRPAGCARADCAPGRCGRTAARGIRPPPRARACRGAARTPGTPRPQVPTAPRRRSRPHCRSNRGRDRAGRSSRGTRSRRAASAQVGRPSASGRRSSVWVEWRFEVAHSSRSWRKFSAVIAAGAIGDDREIELVRLDAFEQEDVSSHITVSSTPDRRARSAP